MARELRFERSVEDGVYTYRFIAHPYVSADDTGGLLERRWAGLPHVLTKPELMGPWDDYAVSPTWREEAALYLGLIWRLTAGRMLYAIPRFHRDAGMRAVGDPYAMVRWELAVESSRFHDTGRIDGFVPARSSPGRGDGTPWGQEAKDRAGLFEICVFRQLRDLLKELSGDQSAELNVFAISSEANAQRLAQTLAASTRPSLAECLTTGEIAVSLTVSSDYVATDVIVVQTLNDIDEILAPLVAEYQAALLRFEETVEEIGDSADFSRGIAELLALGRAGPNSRWAYWHKSPPWAPPQD